MFLTSWRLLLLVWLMSDSALPNQDSGRCECVPGGSCEDQPYGSLALDISVLGIFPPCPTHGYVRCCSRKGLEVLYAGMLKAALTQQPARVEVKPVDLPAQVTTAHSHTDDECGCIPRGICRSSLTRQTSDCNGHLELCCIHDLTHSNVLVNIFSQEDSTVSSTTTAPAPVFRATSSQQLHKQPQPEQDTEGLPCLAALDCNKVYGYDPLDIAKYGVLAPCSRRGFHRCVEPKNPDFSRSSVKQFVTRPTTTARTTTWTTTTWTTTAWTTTTSSTRFDAQSKMRLVPCLPVTLCKGTLYNPGNGLHLARFGVLPRCHAAMSRCIVEVDIRVDSPQPKIRLPFFTKDVMMANFDLPVFTGDHLRAQMHRFFDGKLHEHEKIDEPESLIEQVYSSPHTPSGSFQLNPPTARPSTDESQVNLSDNVRLFLAQLQQRARPDSLRGVQISDTPPGALESDTAKSKQTEVPRGSQLIRSRDSSVLPGSRRPLPASYVNQGSEEQIQQSRNTDVKPDKTSALLALQRLVSVSKEAQVKENKESPTQEPATKFKAPGGSRRIVKVDDLNPQNSRSEPSPKNRNNLRNFFNRRKRPNLFQQNRNKEKDSSSTLSTEKENSISGFPNFQDIAASVEEDRDGNVVISGGRKVFHLPPGIAPPPAGPPSVLDPVQATSESRSRRPQPPVFFDPSDAPQVAEVLKNSKSSIIQVHTDDNQKMVLNVRNDQLIGILQALQSALDSF